MATTVVQIVPTMRDGGAETLMRNLVPRLAARPDLNVHVVSVYDPRLDDDERRALGAPLHVVGRRNRRDVSFAPRLVSVLRQLRPDVVHAHIHSGKFAGRIAAILAGVPNIVFTEHGDEARGVVHWAVNSVLNSRTSRFVVFTEDERQRYAVAQHIPLARIAVIANGIPTPPPIDVAHARAALGLAADDLAIVTPARLVHQKNQELVIRAVAGLRAAGRSEIKLFIVGDGADAESLRSIANDIAPGDTVQFLGYRRDVQQITAACDIMALPSRWEKMPLVLGEAMLAGVPVVSAPWTGVEAFIEDGRTGYLSTDWSVEAYSAALVRAIGDAPLRKAIGMRARAVAAERFDLERTVRLHAELYGHLAFASGSKAQK